MRICIDPGHGGSNKGAYKNPLLERKLNVDAAVIMYAYLSSDRHECILTRITDRSVKNSNRAKMANDFKAHLLISCHHNSWATPGANGFEVLHYPNSKAGIGLSEYICRRVENRWDIRNRGPKPRSDLDVISKSRMPAILIEYGFISSTDDRFYTLLQVENRLEFYSTVAQITMEALRDEEIISLIHYATNDLYT